MLWMWALFVMECTRGYILKDRQNGPKTICQALYLIVWWVVLLWISAFQLLLPTTRKRLFFRTLKKKNKPKPPLNNFIYAGTVLKSAWKRNIMSNSAQLLIHKTLMPQAWNGPRCVKPINLLMTYGRKIIASINPNNVFVGKWFQQILQFVGIFNKCKKLLYD